jgi:hypothetical protein
MKHKVAGWALLAFALFYAVTDPHGAANGIHHALTGLGQLAHGIGAFISALSTS